jgi:hypothetical protein
MEVGHDGELHSDTGGEIDEARDISAQELSGQTLLGESRG